MSGFRSAYKKLQGLLDQRQADPNVLILVCPMVGDFQGWSQLDSVHLESDCLTLRYGKREAKRGNGCELTLWEGEDFAKTGQKKIEFVSEGEPGVVVFGSPMEVYALMDKIERKAMARYSEDY